MGRHEEFLQLCAAATAGELSREERAKLDGHLAVCSECRLAVAEYEIAAQGAIATLADEFLRSEPQATNDSWSVEDAEKAFFKRLEREQQFSDADQNPSEQGRIGQWFTYRPPPMGWRDIWMPFAAVVVLGLALGIAAYRTGIERGSNSGRALAATPHVPDGNLEEQASDAGHERAQLLSKLEENRELIAGLKRELSEQQELVRELKAQDAAVVSSTDAGHQGRQSSSDSGAVRADELAAAQRKLTELQTKIDTASAQRDEAASQAAALQAKVGELTELVRDRERALGEKDAAVAKQQELLEHDRDIRELMGARDLYVAEVHDVSGAGTDRTYGRVFYTKGKSLIFYAYDLDAQPGVKNASSFQAWGRRGPGKEQALSLGIFYEDNLSKKRWVVKASDSKTLDDIDAVFVTVEPTGGSHHPSGKPLLFAYLRITPNHP
jgi:Putative zinc-finger